MSLTFQPFAEAPAIKELRQDLEMNIPASERLESVLFGITVLAATISPKRIGKWSLLAFGAVMAWRGLAGRCPWYSLIGLDRRHTL